MTFLDPGDEVVEPEPVAGTDQERGHDQLGGSGLGRASQAPAAVPPT